MKISEVLRTQDWGKGNQESEELSFLGIRRKERREEREREMERMRRRG